jgi:hypothetical protein
MAGPVPKNPALRQRRNKTATRAELVDEAPRRTRAPQLPRGREWHKLTRAWWREVWASPMAEEYLEADLGGLYILAELVDQFWTMPATGLATEIRLQRQCFGLTPVDRRRLQWEVTRAEDATTRRSQRRVRQAQDGEIDPREALRQVK